MFYKMNNCKFNGEITLDHIKIYNEGKKRKMNLIKQNQLFNVKVWDIAFASSYGFPDNDIGFYGQWMNNKIAPIAKYLAEIDLLENVHICYREIMDIDEQNLDYLCDNIIVNNRLQYKGRRSSGSDEDSYHGKMSFDSIYCLIEECPIEYVCSGYDNFYLEPFGARNGSDDYVTISKYEDIEEVMKVVNSRFYENKEEWYELINKVVSLFGEIGYDKPLWTVFLPENIDKFEEVRVLTNCGNFLHIVARSAKYFYFMQYSH